MRAAPSVHAVLTTGAVERRFVVLLHGITAATLAGWLHAVWFAHDPGSAWVTLLLVPALCALGTWQARRLWPPGPAGALSWSGQAWLWTAPGRDQPEPPLQALIVALDWGHWMLLRAVCHDGRHRWWGASATQAGAAWHGLRVALRAHAGATSAPPPPGLGSHHG